MLTISGLKEGIVLDHIQAGKAMKIYKYLGLDKLAGSRNYGNHAFKYRTCNNLFIECPQILE